MSIIAADTIKSRTAGAAVTTSDGLYVGGACTSISLKVTGVSTAQGGIKVPDSAQAIFGDGDDLAIDHAGGNSRITNSTGWMMINGAQVSINNAAGTEYQATFVADGASSLYYDSSKKFETHNTGVKITGVSTITDLNVTGVATVTSLEATTSIIGSGVTINASGLQVTSGIVTAGTCFKAGGGTWGPGIGATILGSGDSVFAGIVTATTFVPTTGQLGNRNIIINGAFQIAQRGTSATTTDGYGTVDRFVLNYSGQDAGLDQSQHALTSSDTGPWAEGFRYSYHITNGNQTSGAGAADYTRIKYTPEAQDLANSGWDYTNSNSFITISYWVKSSISYTTYINVSTADGTPQNYTGTGIDLTADTWKKVSVSIPGNSNLQFDNNTAAGMYISFAIFYGTDYTTSGHTLNTWSAAGGYTDQLPDMTSTWWTTDDATYEITGVQFEVGPTNTPFEHRTYGEELTRCQRYYQRWNQGYLAGNSQGSDINIGVPLIVPLRAAPTVAALSMHRSGNESVTVSIVGTYYTDLTSTVLRVRTGNWTSMVDETVYTVQPNSDTMEMSAEL